MAGTPFGVGARVIRGQDWDWHDQDGGFGCVGTVSEIGQLGSKRSPEKTVVVCWDVGLRSNYRTGYLGLYDLLVIDNAQCGVRHPNLECDSCKQNGIVGIHFKCTFCYDYDLCSQCYHNDKHNLDHAFVRFDSPLCSGVKLTPRCNEFKVLVKGIFTGALVQRGHDWKWGNQDGGEGSVGNVTDICCWGNESSRSVACVRWKDGNKNDYRVGHKGLMDLKFVTPASGGSYYTNHLPILGKPQDASSLVDRIPQGISPNASQPTVRFCPGDRVRVVLDVDTLKHLQQGHGGWNPRMADYIGKVGIVHRVTEKGDIRVQHENCPNRWTFHPEALVPVEWYRNGDIVKVISDVGQVKKLQKQHGEWVPAMETALGKTGIVTNVYSDGDLRIQILDDPSKKMWTFNPQCVSLVQRCAIQDSQAPNSSPGNGSTEPQPALSQPADALEMRQLMTKVAQGNLEYVKELYEKDKSIIETPYCGKTLLQVAAYQGHRPLVQFLLSKGAKPTAVDDDGDSVLHDAAFGNQPEILEILLSNKDIDINAVNRSRCTALHIAAHKCLPHCVWVLLQHNPNVNLQDTYGDTALHDAINNQCTNVSNTNVPSTSTSEPISSPLAPPLPGSMRIIQMLCDFPDTNFSLPNRRGFNALQHAALKGNGFACAAICRRCPDLIDQPKDDGFSALHLAALNGHLEAVNALVNIGHPDLNLRNNRMQTPLLLAISQGHCSVIEQLVNLGCDITACDEDGNTALHIAFMKRINTQSSEARKPSSRECPMIHNIYERLQTPDLLVNRITYAISIFLMHKGCDPKTKNKDGKCVYDLMASDLPGLKILKEMGDPVSRRLNSESEVQVMESLQEQIIRATQQLQNTIMDSGMSSGINSITNNTETRLPSQSNPVQVPNSSREGAFGGVNSGVNVNASPSKRNYNNLLSCIDLGECSSSNNSPVHHVNIASRGAINKTNNTSSPQHPVRPSRHKKSSSPPDIGNIQSRGKPSECIVCCELSEANCLLEPCGHRPACEDCAARMKKCLICGIIIEKRLTTDGRIIQCRSRQPSAERLRYLECKIQEIEEAHCCPICMERRRSVAFLCGHGACAKCAATLATCHMCRQDITSKINLY